MSKLTLVIFLLSSFNLFSQNLANIGDLKLENGKTIQECKVGYITMGSLNEDSTNVIIFPTWFGGTSKSIQNLIEKTGWIDTTNFYIIIFDALGNSVSSSPSNYKGKFPQITISDMVNSQYQALKVNFGLDKVYGALGGSMGGMQVLEWAAAYPEYIDKVFAYVPSPRLSSYDKLYWKAQLEIIETGKEYSMPSYDIKRLLEYITALNIRTGSYINSDIETDNFNEYFDSFKGKIWSFTNSDFACQTNAMLEHNIYKHYNNSVEETIGAIKSEIFILASKTDLTVNPQPAIELANKGNYKLVLLNNNCGHLAPGCETERTVELINDFFKK